MYHMYLCMLKISSVMQPEKIEVHEVVWSQSKKYSALPFCFSRELLFRGVYLFQARPYFLVHRP